MSENCKGDLLTHTVFSKSEQLSCIDDATTIARHQSLVPHQYPLLL